MLQPRLRLFDCSLITWQCAGHGTPWYQDPQQQRLSSRFRGPKARRMLSKRGVLARQSAARHSEADAYQEPCSRVHTVKHANAVNPHSDQPQPAAPDFPASSASPPWRLWQPQPLGWTAPPPPRPGTRQARPHQDHTRTACSGTPMQRTLQRALQASCRGCAPPGNLSLLRATSPQLSKLAQSGGGTPLGAAGSDCGACCSGQPAVCRRWSGLRGSSAGLESALCP
jgi:hypothetical protein